MDAVINFVRRVIPPTETDFYVPATWVTNGAAIELDFVNNRYWSDPAFVSATDLLSTSRASVGYSLNSAGILTQFAPSTLRITNLGILLEDARTNVVLWNRDLTNGAWVPTNITAAKDQTGPDGVANSASSITATAGNGTILQSITLAASDRYQSAYVKRITGSGTINMTMDNGATWTPVTVTSTWELVKIPTQNLANPTVGFQIVTSGDKIAVDFVQNENGQWHTSPIEVTTTAATRASDSVIVTGDLSTLVVTNIFSIFIDVIVPVGLAGTGGDEAPGRVAQIFMSPFAGHGIYQSNNNAQASVQPPISANYGSGSIVTGAHIAFGQNASGRSLVAMGSSVSSDASNSDFSTGDTYVGGNNNFLSGYIRHLTFWNSRLSDASLSALAAP